MPDVKTYGSTRSGCRYARTNETPDDAQFLGCKSAGTDGKCILPKFRLQDDLYVYQFKVSTMDHGNSLSAQELKSLILYTVRECAQSEDALICNVVFTDIEQPAGSGPVWFTVRISTYNEEDAMIKAVATKVKGAEQSCKKYPVSELVLSCRLKGDYSDKVFPLAGMPIQWVSETYKGQPLNQYNVELIDQIKPEEIKTFLMALSPTQAVDWARIEHKGNTIVPFGYVRFNSDFANAEK